MDNAPQCICWRTGCSRQWSNNASNPPRHATSVIHSCFFHSSFCNTPQTGSCSCSASLHSFASKIPKRASKLSSSATVVSVVTSSTSCSAESELTLYASNSASWEGPVNAWGFSRQTWLDASQMQTRQITVEKRDVVEHDTCGYSVV